MTSLLLEEGWEPTDEGPQGMLWAKGDAESPIPFSLRPGSMHWQSLLMSIAEVENEAVEDLSNRINRYLRSMPDKPVAGDRSQMDLHLDGPGVRNAHETDAWAYGRFVSTLAETVKELVKEATGVSRHRREVQVVGGAQEGSVQVVIREPSAALSDDQASLLDQATEAPERRAMLSLSQIFNASEDAAASPGESTLDAQLNLGPAVRRSVARLAGIMYRARWITRGYFVTPGEETLSIALSMAGCAQLQRSASDERTTVRSRTYHGVLDGWLWSSATMHFISDDQEAIRAAVPMVIQSRVAQLLANPDQRVTATFQVLERQAPNGRTVSQNYALASLTADSALPLDGEGS